MSLTSSEIAAGLVTLLGPESVITEASRMPAYLLEPRKRFFTPAVAVTRPINVAQVQALCRWANENRVPLIPQGGNTGLVGAQVPMRGDEVIVSLGRLNAVRGGNLSAGHLTVEAGMTLAAVHAEAETGDAIFPLTLGSQGSAQVGGVLSSNAGGTQVLAYGNARELCLGVEAVLADGRLYNGLGSLRKDNTGYDLKDLFVGAEGTLGVITAATLKVFPKPEGYETAVLSVSDPAAALEAFYAMRDRLTSTLTAFEIIPKFGLELLLRHRMLDRDPTAGHSPWYVMAEVSRPVGGTEGGLLAALEDLLGRGMIDDAVIAESLGDRARMWAFRENMSEVQTAEGASIKHDVSVPIAMVPRLLEEGIAAVERIVPGIRVCPFGHMGDGNIHFNLTQPVDADPKAFMATAETVHAAIYDIVRSLDGSVSAEHGIGQLKVDLLKQVKDPVALQLMRSVKQALDPNGIMNPGKMLG